MNFLLHEFRPGNSLFFYGIETAVEADKRGSGDQILVIVERVL